MRYTQNAILRKSSFDHPLSDAILAPRVLSPEDLNHIWGCAGDRTACPALQGQGRPTCVRYWLVGPLCSNLCCGLQSLYQQEADAAENMAHPGSAFAPLSPYLKCINILLLITLLLGQWHTRIWYTCDLSSKLWPVSLSALRSLK